MNNNVDNNNFQKMNGSVQQPTQPMMPQTQQVPVQPMPNNMNMVQPGYEQQMGQQMNPQNFQQQAVQPMNYNQPVQQPTQPMMQKPKKKMNILRDILIPIGMSAAIFLAFSIISVILKASESGGIEVLSNLSVIKVIASIGCIIVGIPIMLILDAIKK